MGGGDKRWNVSGESERRTWTRLKYVLARGGGVGEAEACESEGIYAFSGGGVGTPQGE